MKDRQEFSQPEERARQIPKVNLVPGSINGELDTFDARIREIVTEFGLNVLPHEDSETPQPDLNILINPVEVGKAIGEVRSQFPASPIFVISNNRDWETEARALNCGADAYLSPRSEGTINGDLIKAQIRALLRRNINNTTQPEEPVEDEIIAGDLEVSLSKGTVKRNGALVDLSRTEWNMLATLATYRNEVVTFEEALTVIYKSNFHENHQWTPTDREYVRTIVGRLRKRVDPQRQLIKNCIGRGYMLVTSHVDSNDPQTNTTTNL